jgi:Tfp pilus assembly protein PilF
LKSPSIEHPLLKVSAHTVSKDPWWLQPVGFAILVVALVVAYSPALRGELLWDDNAHITGADLRSWRGLWRIWFDLGATQQYYPLLHSAFWLEYKLWGDAVLGYHLVNVGQHAVSAMLLAYILQRLSVPGAWLAAAIFALHPVHVESVAWISEQKNTLSLLFYLAAAVAYLRFDAERSRGYYVLAFVLFILALLSKTVTASLPAALLVIFWWKRGRLSWRTDILPLIPWLILGAGAGLFTAWVETHLIGATRAGIDLTWPQRFQLAGRVLWFYAGKLIWPDNLTFIYPRWTVDAGNLLYWIPSIGSALLAMVLWSIRRFTRTPLSIFLLYAGTLFPVLGFITIYPFRYSFVADHFQYHASLSLLGLLSAACSQLTKLRFETVKTIIVWTVPAVLGLLTHQQAGIYRNSITLYRATIDRNPTCWMAHNNLGLILSESGQRTEAVSHFRSALSLNPDYPEAHNNLGLFLSQSGHFDQAISHLEQAVRLDPGFLEAYNNLGIALAGQGRPEDAVAAFMFALRLEPDSPRIHSNLAKALLLAGRSDDAAEHAAKAAKLRAKVPASD